MTGIWAVEVLVPVGDAYATLRDEGRLVEIVGPLDREEHAAAWAGDCAGNGEPEDVDWAVAIEQASLNNPNARQRWQLCECEVCTAALQNSEWYRG